MDDPYDGKYSRAPELSDLVTLCRALNQEGVRYLLIGGFAVILHGFARGTKDVDLLVDASTSNVQALKRAMAVLPDNAVAEIEDDDVRKYTVVRVADEIVVDLMEKACGIDYLEAEKDTMAIEVQDVVIPTASPRLLIRTKDTYRPSDRMDVEFLLEKIGHEGTP